MNEVKLTLAYKVHGQLFDSSSAADEAIARAKIAKLAVFERDTIDHIFKHRTTILDSLRMVCGDQSADRFSEDEKLIREQLNRRLGS